MARIRSILETQRRNEIRERDRLGVTNAVPYSRGLYEEENFPDDDTQQTTRGDEMPTPFSYMDTHRLWFMLNSARNEFGVLETAVTASRLKFGLSTTRKREEYFAANPHEECKPILSFLKERGYLFHDSKSLHLAIRDGISGEYATACAFVGLSHKTITVIVNGDPTEVDEILQFTDGVVDAKGTLIYTANEITEGDVKTTKSHVSESSAEVARDNFYPWLNISLKEYFKAFMEASEPILVMFGPPGTGKSTFLRSLILSGCYTSMLAYNRDVVESSILIDKFYSEPPLRILAYEDIDSYLKRREDGNKLMSTILNSSDGVVQHPEKKLVFSTNLESIDSIDPALLRTGRCFDILRFELLTGDQGTAILSGLNMEAKDFSSKPKWTLAEVLRKKNIAQQAINRFGDKKIGFV